MHGNAAFRARALHDGDKQGSSGFPYLPLVYGSLDEAQSLAALRVDAAAAGRQPFPKRGAGRLTHHTAIPRFLR